MNNDWLSQRFRDIENQLSLMGNALTQKADNGMVQLRRLLDSGSGLPSQRLRTMMPMLITHPLDRWPWLIDQALWYGLEKNPR